MIKDYKKARDIDLAVIVKEEEFKEVNSTIRQRQEILPKAIHSIEITEEDFISNLNKGQEAMKDIAKNGIILFGSKKYVEVIKNVTGF